MTIFHVLKYSIPEEPTLEQMDAIPEPIMELWSKYVNENDVDVYEALTKILMDYTGPL